MGEERVGLVLTGGGARGAYEVGALSVLLPALEAAGQRPTVLVGTSVGAINIAYLAANAHLGAADAVAGAVELWHSLRWEQVLAPLLAPSTALRKLSYVGDVLGVPGVQLTALLDTTPLTEDRPTGDRLRATAPQRRGRTGPRHRRGRHLRGDQRERASSWKAERCPRRTSARASITSPPA